MDTNTEMYNAYIKGNHKTDNVSEEDLYNLVCESTINEDGIVTHPYEKMLIGDISDHKIPETLTEAYNKVHYIPDELFNKVEE